MANYRGNGQFAEEFRVPRQVVPLIMGPNGEQLAQLQARSGCNIFLCADFNIPTCDPGFILSGGPQAIKNAKALMIQLMNTVSLPLYLTRGNHFAHADIFITMQIPGPKVPILIGKAGETLQTLQVKAGVKMILTEGNPILPMNKRQANLMILGQPQECEYAKQLVEELISEEANEAQSQKEGKSNQNTGNSKTAQKKASKEKNNNNITNKAIPTSGTVQTNKKSNITATGDVTNQCQSTLISGSEDCQEQKEFPVQIENVVSSTKHSCKYCLKGEHVFQEISQYLENFFVKQQFRCQTCNFIFCTKKSFKNHLNARVGKECDTTYIPCRFRLAKQVKAKDNQKDGSIKNNGKMTYICDFCPKSISLEITILEHNETNQAVDIDANLTSSKSRHAETSTNDLLCPSLSKNIHASTKEPCQIPILNANAHLNLVGGNGSLVGPSAQSSIPGTSKQKTKNTPTATNNETSEKNTAKFVCNLCSMEYVKRRGLNKHFRNIHNINVRGLPIQRKKLNSDKGYVKCIKFFALEPSLEDNALPKTPLCGKGLGVKVTQNSKKAPSKVMCEQRIANTNQQSSATASSNKVMCEQRKANTNQQSSATASSNKVMCEQRKANTNQQSSATASSNKVMCEQRKANTNQQSSATASSNKVMWEQRKANRDQQSSATASSKKSATLGDNRFSVEEFANHVLSSSNVNGSLAKVVPDASKESDSLKTFTCPICSWTCLGSNNMLTHSLTHVHGDSEIQKSTSVLKVKEKIEIDLNKVKTEFDDAEAVSFLRNNEEEIGGSTGDQTVNACKINKMYPKSATVHKKKNHLLHVCRICLHDFKSLNELNEHTDEHFSKTGTLQSHQSDHELPIAKRQKV